MTDEKNQPRVVPTFGHSILFLSPDGMLEPLGKSQVIPYLLGLARLGFGYEILSLERDCQEGETEAELRARLDAGGISWTPLPYDSRGIARLLNTYWRAWVELSKQWKSGKFACIHARSFVMGLLAQKVAAKHYLFDARGYWVDERKEAGRWFQLPAFYRLGKRLELKVAQDSAAIITLTDLQRDDFHALMPGKPIVTITTCTDFSRFRPDVGIEHVPKAIRSRLEGKLVLGLIGSVNRFYRIQDSLRLFSLVRAVEPSAHLLCLTRHERDLREHLSRAALAEPDFTISTAPHDEMPEWMSLVHWGLLLLENSPAKRASMPTKLGEMFASGVRPVQYGCNEEVGRMVRDAGSGLVLSGLGDQDLHEAAAQIVRIGKSKEGTSQASQRMKAKFSLETGTIKYAQLLATIMNRPQARQPMEEIRS